MSNATIRNMAVAAAAGLAASVTNAQLTETQTVSLEMPDILTWPTIVFDRFDAMGGTRQLTGVSVNAVHDADLTYTILNYTDAVAFDEWFYEINMFMLYEPVVPDFGGGGEEEEDEEGPIDGPVPVPPPSFPLDLIGATLDGVDLPAGISNGPFDPFAEPSVTEFPFPTLNLDITNTATCEELNFFAGEGAMEGRIITFDFGLLSAPFDSFISGFATLSTSGTISLTYEYRDVTGLRESAFAGPTDVLDAFDLFGFLNELEADDVNAEYTSDAVRDQLDYDAFIGEYLPCEPTTPGDGGPPLGGGDGPGDGPGGPGL